MATGTILARLARVWWVTALLAILGGLGGFAYSQLAPSTYVAKAYVAVVADNQAESPSAVSYAQTYARVVTQSDILRAAASGGVATESQLRGNVQAVGSTDSPVIEISGSADTAPRAATFANAVSDSLVTEANKHTARTRMSLTVLSAATAPETPTSPSPGLDVAIGVAVGALLGGLIVLARTDQKSGGGDRRRDRDDLAAVAGAPDGAGTAAGLIRGPERWNDVPTRWNGHSEPGGSAASESDEPGRVRR